MDTPLSPIPSVVCHYLADADVDAEMDSALRKLLSNCFTGPANARFKTQRYYHEMPAHRWLIRSVDGSQLVAHLALHEKVLHAADDAAERIAIGGIAEVCVDPAYRGRGYVKALLEQAHGWLTKRNIDYAVLYGDDEIYGSSGYRRVENIYLRAAQTDQPEQWRAVSAMVCALASAPWPEGGVRLEGETF